MTLKELLASLKTNRKSIGAVKKALKLLESERLRLATDLRDKNYKVTGGCLGIRTVNHILRSAGLEK